eukprot:1841700-Karenia_brevis.AAC.1
MLKRAIAAFPEISYILGSYCPDACLPEGINKLEKMIATYLRTSVEERMREVEEIKDLPEYEKSKQLKGLARMISRFSLR